MCGIAGRVSLGSRSPEGWESEALRLLAPRGPDDRGVHLEDGGAVHLVHTRLSILDTSSAGHQPMMSASGASVIVFNGELYNFSELANRLKGRGWVPRSGSDTEIVVEFIERFGLSDFLECADGMFALAHVNRRTKEVALARDPFGEKPLYWMVAGDAIAFASDPRVVARASRTPPALDAEALRAYLWRGHMVGDSSPWLDVRKLRPGSALVARRGPSAWDTSFRVYFDPTSEWLRLRAEGGPPASDDEVEDLLARNIKRRLVADVPVGSLLSGGIDSSLVTALAARHTNSLATFTVGIDDPSLDESTIARRTSAQLGTHHFELRIAEADALGAVHAALQSLAEPLADASIIPTYLVCRFAANRVKVALTGDGGDELFAGYTRYLQFEQAMRVRASVFGMVARVGEATMLRLDPTRDFGVSVLGPRKVRQLTRVLRFLGATGIDEAYSELTSQSMHGVVRASYPVRKLVLPKGESPIEYARMSDFSDYLPDDICTKTDRASMACGLELRTPFLERSLFRVAARYRTHSLVGGRHGKLPLRRAASRALGEWILEPPKRGFGVPIDAWMRHRLGGLYEESRDLLAREGLLDLLGLDDKVLRKRYDEHRRGRRLWGQELWALLTLGAWYQHAGE